MISNTPNENIRLTQDGLKRSKALLKKYFDGNRTTLHKKIELICDDAPPSRHVVSRYFGTYKDSPKGISYKNFRIIQEVLWAKEPPIPDWQEIAEEVGKEKTTVEKISNSSSKESAQFSVYNPETFAGRAEVINALTAILKGSCRILAITGITGIGKTALAEAIVANLQGVASNTLPYLRFSLDSLNTYDFFIGGTALLWELGKKLSDSEMENYQKKPEKLLHDLVLYLREQPCRLQIDSLERLLQGNEEDGWEDFTDPLWLEFLRQFLANNNCSSQLLLTTQEIPADLEFIANRSPNFWHCETIQGLSLDEQIEMFRKLGLPQDEQSLEALSLIGNFFDGHPLVLKLVGYEIQSYPYNGSVSRYFEKYKSEFTDTPTPTSNPITRSRVFLRRARKQIERTLSRLPEPARQMFCASAVFRRPVPDNFWQEMLDEDDPEDAFDVLLDRHLVEQEIIANDTWLVYQHNLVHSVAYEMLQVDYATWHSAERQAAHLWLTAYEPARSAPSLETVRGYLEAVEHYSIVED
jgi:hypothetical protein